MIKIVFLALLITISSFSYSQAITVLSLQSLYIEVLCKNSVVMTGTGFIMRVNKKDFLITNWHVATGRDFYQPGRPMIIPCIPDAFRVYYSGKELGRFMPTYETLLGHFGTPLFKEIFYNDSLTDIVAIPIKESKSTKFYPAYIDSVSRKADDLSAGRMVRALIRPATDLLVVGYPLGERSFDYFPIYKRGMVASEPQLNYNEWPAFLIDATTKRGMSGSPVYYFNKSEYSDGSNQTFMGGPFIDFKGIYSAQNDGTGIGVVWKADFLIKILEGF